MTIAIRSVSSVTAASGTSPISVNKPTGTIIGDMMLLHIGHSNDKAPTVPSGWTALPAAQSGGATESSRIDIYYKVATASEPASYSISWSGSDNLSAAIIAWYSDDGHNLTIDDSDVNVTTDGTRVWKAVSSTYTSWAISDFGTFGINANSTPPALSIEQYDSGSTVRMYLMTLIVAGAGTTGTRTATGIGSGTMRLASVVVAETAVGIAPPTFGVRDSHIAPWLATDSHGTSVDVPSIQFTSVSLRTSSADLVGDYGTNETYTKVIAADVKLRFGGVSIAALEVMLGLTATSSVASPNRVKQFKIATGGAALPCFSVTSVADDLDGLGNLTVYAPKVQIVGDINLVQMEFGTFAIPECAGVAVADGVYGVVSLLEYRPLGS